MTIIATIEDYLSRGAPVTVECLGGMDRILADADALLAAPLLDVVAKMVAVAQTAEQDILVPLLLRGFVETGDPASFRDAIEVLIQDSALRARMAAELAPVLTTRVDQRAEGRSGLIAAYALEALFRLAVEGAVTRHRVLMVMSELRDNESSLFVEHAAKLVGAAYHAWGGDELLATLSRLQTHDEAEGEAAFELGLALLANALAADSMEAVLGRMDAAYVLFRQARRADEDRADAVAYCAVIDLIRGFVADRPADDLQQPLADLTAALADRDNLLRIGKPPGWLQPRRDRDLEWLELSRCVHSAARDLTRPSWLHAATTMERVLAVYDAERTISGGDGVSMLLRPRIEASFVRERGLVAHLDDLLADTRWPVAHQDAARKLRSSLASRQQSGPDPGKAEENASYPLLAGVLRDLPSAEELPTEMAAILESALADRLRRNDRIANPVVHRIFAGLRASFVGNSEYEGPVREDFDALLLQILLFCADRQNADRKELGPRGDYLRDPKAKEGALQADLRQWLKGNMPSAEVLTEVPGIATGRTDIYVGFGGHRFIAELKRHEGYVDQGTARNFREQAGSYQATNVRLGFLGILELVDRPGPPASLEECLWYDAYVPAGSQLARHLIVFRVPGMLKLPSSLG